jgi:hypothetical protein
MQRTCVLAVPGVSKTKHARIRGSRSIILCKEQRVTFPLKELAYMASFSPSQPFHDLGDQISPQLFNQASERMHVTLAKYRIKA